MRLRTIMTILGSVIASLTALGQTVFNATEDTGSRLRNAKRIWEAGQTQTAESLYKSACEIATNPQEALDATCALANFYGGTNRPQEAVRLYDQLLQDDDIANDSLTLTRIYEGLGEIYSSTGQHVKAIKSFQMSLSISRNIQTSQTQKAHLLNNMAKTFMQAGDVTIALALTDSARMIVNDTDFVNQANIMRTSAEICALMGRHKRAYQELTQSNTIQELLWAKDKHSILNETNPVFNHQKNIAKNQYESILDEKDHSIADVQNDLKISRIGLTIVGVILLLITIALIIMMRKSAEDQRQISHLNKRCQDYETVTQIVANETSSQFNTLLGFANILLDNTRKNPKATPEDVELTQIVYSSAQKLHHSVTNMLTWNETKERIDPHRETVDVMETLQTTLQTCEMMANEKGVTLQNEMTPSTYAIVDPIHLDVVVFNLIFNSIRYCGKNGKVTIAAFAHNNKTHISIEDSGMGVNNSIVNKFNNCEELSGNDIHSVDKGTELGLMICRDLILANKGEIMMESKIGKGTSINIILPVG